ncbi:MAG: hypothetical protein ACYC0Q_05310 [Eubacteriales bacterium]|nr:hypothetical protein [Bacillota bacterium]
MAVDRPEVFLANAREIGVHHNHHVPALWIPIQLQFGLTIKIMRIMEIEMLHKYNGSTSEKKSGGG